MEYKKIRHVEKPLERDVWNEQIRGRWENGNDTHLEGGFLPKRLDKNKYDDEKRQNADHDRQKQDRRCRARSGSVRRIDGGAIFGRWKKSVFYRRRSTPGNIFHPLLGISGRHIFSINKR